ncbi:uncharacterized protein LOC143011886 [Genypterus blacodes]|uniref:uncharacterized protein LOC143011886 n=1 Tax=Genypterus blacodes TaxID=154954 RepID=UPI003F77702D
MELHCLPAETLTRASSSATDPLYDNYCPPYAQKGTDRRKEKEMESRVLCPAVTRLSKPPGPTPAPAPAVAQVPTLVGGGRGPGGWPEHSYCSWSVGLGRPGQGAELPRDINTGRGGRRGPEGVRGEVQNRGEDRVRPNRSPSPSQSQEHTSALSVYDNLPEAGSPGSVQEVTDMDTSFQERWQEQMYQAWAPELMQDLMEEDGLSAEKSSWSSCEIMLPGSESSNQEPNPGQQKTQEQESEPEPASGSCTFEQSVPVLPPQVPMSLPQPQLAASPPQPPMGQALWPREEAQNPEQPAWGPREPPPVPLADPNASALRSLLTNLQQQIGRQREEYEERILSLEQRNEELQVEVIRLRTNLIQQRQWYQAVQVKIVESERGRAAAEHRNGDQQREMEQFFDTFGELNNEAKKTECIVKGL